MNFKALVAASAALFLVACSDDAADNGDNGISSGGIGSSSGSSDSSSSDSGSGGSGPKAFPFKEGTLVYEMTGTQTGTQTTYIRDYGREQVQELDATMTIPGMSAEQAASMGINTKQQTLTKSDPDWIYVVDQQANTGSKMPNPIKSLWGDSIDDPREFGLHMMKQMGGKQTGNDNHNGTDCEVWELAMANSKTCISDDGIMQYTRVNMMGMEQNVELVSMETGDTDDSKFVLPDMEFKEMPGMDELMKGISGQ